MTDRAKQSDDRKGCCEEQQAGTLLEYSVSNVEFYNLTTYCPPMNPNMLSTQFWVRATAALPTLVTGDPPDKYEWVYGHPRAFVQKLTAPLQEWGPYAMSPDPSGTYRWITNTQIGLGPFTPGTVIKARVEAHYKEKFTDQSLSLDRTLYCP